MASTLLAARDAELGLSEVDEGALPEVAVRVRPRALCLGNLLRDPDRIARWARARYSAGRPGHPPRRRIHRRHGRHRVPGGLARSAGGVRIRGAGNGPDQVPSPMVHDLEWSIWGAAAVDEISSRSLDRVPAKGDLTAAAVHPQPGCRQARPG